MDPSFRHEFPDRSRTQSAVLDSGFRYDTKPEIRSKCWLSSSGRVYESDHLRFMRFEA